MVYIPSGEFSMGSSVENAYNFCLSLYESNCCSLEQFLEFNLVSPNEYIEINAFYMDKSEVSLESYLDCIEVGVCDWLSVENEYMSFIGNPQMQIDIPVTGITYYDAAVYCAWREGRLPTEAEWEYAAVGSTGHVFSWGNSSENVPANFCDSNCPINPDTRVDDGFELFAPIESYLDGQSWAGIVNLSGNAPEWTSSRIIGGDGVFNDIRIVKGGSYLSPIHELLVWMRQPTNANIASNNGFRCVREV